MAAMSYICPNDSERQTIMNQPFSGYWERTKHCIVQRISRTPLSPRLQVSGGSSYWARRGRSLLAAMTLSALGTYGSQAQPAGPPALAQEQFLCRLAGTSDRLIGIYRPPVGAHRCRVDYTRDGKTRSLWSAGYDYQFCVRKALEIVGLLEGVNFECSPQTRKAAGAAANR
jgi:hypothetical protein